MIKSFKIYESVNINFFYLVLRNQPNTFENLAKLKLDGLKGISDNYNIARHWKLYTICNFLSAPEVFYKIEHYFENKEFEINNLNDLTNYIIEAIKELPNIGNNYPWSKSSWDESQEITTNATKKEIEKVLKIGISYRCDAHKDEGEWYNYSDKFIIPKKSILFFKEDVGRYIKYGSHGMESEEIKSIINQYSLNKYYKISKVANHEEMTEILIKKYLNE